MRVEDRGDCGEGMGGLDMVGGEEVGKMGEDIRDVIMGGGWWKCWRRMVRGVGMDGKGNVKGVYVIGMGGKGVELIERGVGMMGKDGNVGEIVELRGGYEEKGEYVEGKKEVEDGCKRVWVGGVVSGMREKEEGEVVVGGFEVEDWDVDSSNWVG